MRRYITLTAALALATAAHAEDATPETGGGLMQRGLQMFMEGLRQEVEPALEGLEGFGPEMMGFLREMGPALAQIMEEIKDWSAYHPPEILPNGDIIIRRKDPAAAADPDAPIEL